MNEETMTNEEGSPNKDYELDFGCYRGELFRDGGVKKITALNDKAAIGFAFVYMADLRKIGRYDRIDYRLKEGERLVTGNC